MVFLSSILKRWFLHEMGFEIDEKLVSVDFSLSWIDENEEQDMNDVKILQDMQVAMKV